MWDAAMSRPAGSFGRLTRLSATTSGRERQRLRLLAWLQVSILLLAFGALILVLVIDSSDTSRRDIYIALILGLIALFAIALGFARAGRYTVSACLTVAGAVLGPWGSLAADPAVARGDFVPLVYVSVSVVLCSVLLPTLMTVVLAALQLAALTAVMVLGPSTPINWASLIGFIVIASLLSIILGVVRHQDKEQIDDQTRQLALSEARFREDAIRDHLTGLFNRRYLEETLEREVRRVVRRGRPLGLIMLDIDHFKRFNDAFGHAAGDALLHELGALLKRLIRDADIACRYGGEEFLLILPEASLAATCERAELVRDQVNRLRVDRNGQMLDAVTVSLGVALSPDHGSTAETALKAADTALYRAKREGRDRVVVADEDATTVDDAWLGEASQERGDRVLV